MGPVEEGCGMKINCQTYGFRNNRDWHRWERKTQQRIAQMDSGKLIEEPADEKDKGMEEMAVPEEED